MPIENFDQHAAAQQVSEQITPRLYSLGPNEDTIAENAHIIQEFNTIAAGILNEDPGITMPGSDQIIPLNVALAMQGLTLFAEGIYHVLVKCVEMGLTSNIVFQPRDEYGNPAVDEAGNPVQEQLKIHLLQQYLALTLLDQAKQIVASTYGQEATPEFQFTMEMQVTMIAQSAENALSFYINEHERRYGPIEVEFPEEVPLPSVEEIMTAAHEHDTPAEPLPEVMSPPVAPKIPQAKGPTPHDKYAAVALLLTTLPQEQRTKVLRNFNAEEKELISFYSYPQHIEQNLDIASVKEHLKRFKEMVKQGAAAAGSLKSQAYKSIGKLVEAAPPEMLLSCVKDERPVIKQYLEQHLGLHETNEQDGELAGTVKENRHSPENLPPELPYKVEEVLHRYLQQQLGRAQANQDRKTSGRK